MLGYTHYLNFTIPSCFDALRELELPPVPGSAKRQSLHIPAEPELRPRVTPEPEAHLSAPGPLRPPGSKYQTSSQRVKPGSVQMQLSQIADQPHKSLLSTALASRNINRPQISQHGDQTITTNLPKTARRPAVRHVTYHVFTSWTHFLADCYTHIRTHTERKKANAKQDQEQLLSPRRTRISITADYLHPFTLKGAALFCWDRFSSAKTSIFTRWQEHATTYLVQKYNCCFWLLVGFCSGFCRCVLLSHPPKLLLCY